MERKGNRRVRAKSGHRTTRKQRKTSRASGGPAALKRTSARDSNGLGFPLVAVGASAGGLEAFTTLLRHLPEDTGMAFVLVQHLDPTKESILDEILQKSTRLPVRRIEKGLKLSPNTVFVVPPAGRVELRNDGIFDVIPKIRGVHGGSPIDDFFRSAAEQFHSRVIGVVLSGTLSDGALGLAAIKAEGGVTFAQDATSAAFSEMPRAAALSGAADMVLPPDRIAKEIARISRHPYVQKSAEEDAPATEFKDGSAGKRLLQMLRSGTGVDFSDYRQSTFRRRVQRRMALKRITTLPKYVDFIRSNPGEIQALFDDILINVTRFFRDAEIFETIRTRVIPEILKGRPPDSPIRVWVPGCATGEEVYSIGILLLEAIQLQETVLPVQIFATDISERALDIARAGEYLEGAVRDVSPDRLKRYFTRTSAGYQISKAVRDLCIFARQNVAVDPPFSGLDMLSCRNLLIYLDPKLQERVFPSFHYALKRGGFLILGRSESLGRFAEHFQPFDRNGRIFVKADVRVALPPETMGAAAVPRLPARASEAAPLQPPLNKIDVPHLADRVVLNRYAPAGVLLNELYEIVQFRGRTAAYLEPTGGAATLNVFKMTRPGLLGPLRAAVLKARKTGESVRRGGVKIPDRGKMRTVDIEVTPIRQGPRGAVFFLVLFEDPRLAATLSRQPIEVPRVGGSSNSSTVRTLEQELGTTKEYLQAIIEEQEASNEELKSANEEILSANEELQSTNEELETAKEELQSTNEELTTVNEELQNRNAELAYAHNDLVNIFGINLPIVMVSANGAIRRVTSPAERLFNLGPRDIGRKLSEFRPRLRNVDLSELVENVSDTLGTVDREVQDETGNWYSLRIRPYRTIDNRIDGTIIALFDLRSTEQITRSRDYADAVLETVRESLVILDESLRVRSANKAFYARVRMAPGQVEGKSISELWQLPERAPELQYFLERALTERDPIVNYELEIDLGSPGRRSLLINARRLQPAGEAKPYILMAFEDITERKWIEQGLRASELRYRLLFETAREGIWLLDGDTGKVLDANPFLLELLGVTKDAIVGRQPWDLYSDPNGARARFEEILKRGFSFDPALTMRTKSGGEVRVEAVSNLYSVGASRVVQSNMRDLTDRSRLEADLRQMQKLESIGNLAGGVAHDFNNILNIISAHSAVLGRAPQGRDGARQRESADAIEAAVRRGAGVVRQLLTFARRTETSFEPLDVNGLVEELRKMVVETFPKTLQLRMELAPDLPRIMGDPNQIQQALLNLVVNARDEMPRGGTITVKTRAVAGETLRRRLENADSEEYVAIEVADQGPGMTEEVRKRLFEPFFTTKEKGKGVGMGLAVVYGVVQSHQGTIDVESHPGKGTCFALYFPVSNAAAQREPQEKRGRTAAPVHPGEASAVSGDGNGKGRTILFVEDEELLQTAIRSLLEDQGYRVLSAVDGLEAVEMHAAHKSEIDAVIVDLGLPKLDGWEAFVRMKKSDPNLKAIVASGTLDAEKRSRMRREGVQATLRKPYGAREIMKALQQVLET